MIKLIKKITHNKEGQSIVELALTLPILLIILCAIIDFGWIFSNKLTISYCSREGARYAIVNSSSTQAIIDRVIQIAPSHIRDSINVSVVFSNPSARRVGDVTVTVNGSVKALTPIPGVFIKDEEIELSSKCVMKVE